jgi:hypothetical protein
MECDFNLLCYEYFLILFFNYSKSFKNNKKNNFEILFICFITSWFEIGNGKKKEKSISSKYSYLKLVFNYIRKGFWKGIIIYWNCDTLVCFCTCVICIFWWISFWVLNMSDFITWYICIHFALPFGTNSNYVHIMCI